MGALGLQALLAGKRATYTLRSISSSCGLFSVFLRPGKGGDSRGKRGKPGKLVYGFQDSFFPGQVLWLVHHAP